jgi:hypothetical protein
MAGPLGWTIAVTLLSGLGGCAGVPGSAGSGTVLPPFHCRGSGEIALTGSGQISAVAGATNSWSIQGNVKCPEGLDLTIGTPIAAPDTATLTPGVPKGP